MLLETTGLDIAKYVVIVFQILVCFLLILVVMMQRPKQEGLGAAFGGDTMDSLTGAHATDFLQKGTAFLGTVLFILTFILSVLVISGAADKNKSLANASEKAPTVDETLKSPDAKKAVGDLNPDPDSEDPEEDTPSTDPKEGDKPTTEGEEGGTDKPATNPEAGDKPTEGTEGGTSEEKPAEEEAPKPVDPAPAPDKPATEDKSE